MNKKITDMQSILLEMMKLFHEFCGKHDIKYYMLGGTLIGAIRHEGFIPWDDDIDIGIPREDYDRLLQMPEKLLPNGLEIISYKNNSNYPFAFAKLLNKNTTLIENNFGGVIGGVYIDLFPIDGAGTNKIINKLHFNYVKINYSFLWYSHLTEKKDTVIKNIVKYIAKLIGDNFWQNKTEKSLKHYSYKQSKYVGNLLGVYNEREIVPKEYFGTPNLYKFEGFEFYGLEKYDEYLTNIYGEYMKLPPLDKQKSHHKIKYINLKLPYRDYKRYFKIN